METILIRICLLKLGLSEEWSPFSPDPALGAEQAAMTE
jgi:hypothetical protein